MTRISVELVPRSATALLAEAASLAQYAPWADTINIPDLTRFELRSWTAAGAVAEEAARPDGSPYTVVPHLRARDLVDRELPRFDQLGITEVLIVSGDIVDSDEPAEQFECLEVISRAREEFPQVTVWAGLDPWRGSMSSELDYLSRKLEAGASGVFTQPFFDLNLLRAWSGVLPRDVTVWWGATTVTSERSQQYWRKRNLVAFPDDFRPDLTWHRDFAQKAIDLVCELGQNLYLMPVRTSPTDYLGGLRGPA